MFKTADCERVTESVYDFLEKKLPADERRAIDEHLRGCDHCLDVQVGLVRQRTADAHRRIGLAYVQRGAIGLRTDRDSTQAHPARGARDPPRDLATVGDQHAGEVMEHDRRCVPMQGLPLP